MSNSVGDGHIVINNDDAVNALNFEDFSKLIEIINTVNKYRDEKKLPHVEYIVVNKAMSKKEKIKRICRILNSME